MRILLGLLSVMPLLIVLFVFSSAVASAAGGGGVGILADDSDAGFFLFLALCVGLGLFSMALVVYYMVFIFRSDRVKAEHKALWAIVLFVGNAIGFPLFWYFYFWRDAEAMARGER
jgi:hypothetical protein